MKNYAFLFKPIFFIFNLIFATWLVLKIEKIKPSDFGEHKSIFESAPKPRVIHPSDKEVIKTFCMEFKYGFIDSTQLRKKLDKFLASPDEMAEDVPLSGNKGISAKSQELRSKSED